MFSFRRLIHVTPRTKQSSIKLVQERETYRDAEYVEPCYYATYTPLQRHS
jgi:hypothetical protein